MTTDDPVSARSPHLPAQVDALAWAVDVHGRLCDEHGMMMDSRTAADRYNAIRSRLESRIADLTSAPPPIVAELERLREWFKNSYDVERCEFSPGDWKTIRDRELARAEAAEKERDELRAQLDGIKKNITCGACAEALFCGSVMHQHSPDCVYSERDGLQEGFDALVKGTIAAKEKSNAELEKLRAKLQVAVESAWREGLSTGHCTDNYFPDEWWPKSKAAKALAQLDAEGACPRCGAISQQEADDGKCDGTGCDRSDQPQCKSWLGGFDKGAEKGKANE